MVTQAQILDVATFIEFKEVARLANGGDPIAAYRCWMRSVEILHSPFIVPTTSELEKFPPTLEALCLQHPCHRCAPHFGSFKFLWVEQRYHRSARGTASQWSGSSSMDLVCWCHCWEPSGSTGCGTPTRGMDSICEGQGDVVWKDGSWKPSFQVQVTFGKASAIAAHSCYANIAWPFTQAQASEWRLSFCMLSQFQQVRRRSAWLLVGILSKVLLLAESCFHVTKQAEFWARLKPSKRCSGVLTWCCPPTTLNFLGKGKACFQVGAMLLGQT